MKGQCNMSPHVYFLIADQDLSNLFDPIFNVLFEYDQFNQKFFTAGSD